MTTSGVETGEVFLADCGAFDLWDRFVFEWNGKLFFDENGNPARIVEHVGGSDTFNNSVTGESVTGTINSGETVDFVNGTVTQNGTIGRITVPVGACSSSTSASTSSTSTRVSCSWPVVITASSKATTPGCVSCSP